MLLLLEAVSVHSSRSHNVSHKILQTALSVSSSFQSRALDSDTTHRPVLTILVGESAHAASRLPRNDWYTDHPHLPFPSSRSEFFFLWNPQRSAEHKSQIHRQSPEMLLVLHRSGNLHEQCRLLSGTDCGISIRLLPVPEEKCSEPYIRPVHRDPGIPT